MFRGNISLPTSGSKSNPSNKPEEAGGKLSWWDYHSIFLEGLRNYEKSQSGQPAFRPTNMLGDAVYSDGWVMAF
jgi:hypothetical protein